MTVGTATPTNTLTVEGTLFGNNAQVFEVYAITNQLNKVIVVNDGGTLEGFQVVSEFFSTGERVTGSENEGRLPFQAFAGNVRQSPILVGLVGFAFPKIVEVRGVVEEIAGDEGDHFRIASTVFAEIEDDGVHVGEKIHGSDCGGSANIRVGEEIEFDVADVARKMFDLFETTIRVFHVFVIAREVFGRRLGFFGTIGRCHGAVVHVEMLVVTDGAEVVGKFFGESGAVGDGVVFTALLASANVVFHFLGDVGENVTVVELFDGAVDDAGTFGGIDVP